MLFLLSLEYFGKLFFGGRFVLYEISLRLKSGEHFVLRIIDAGKNLSNMMKYINQTIEMFCKLGLWSDTNFSGSVVILGGINFC